MTKRHICYIVSGILSILFTTFLITLILAQTVFKPRHPILQSLSSSVEHVSTHVSPPFDVQLNFTLTLQMKLTNPNLVDFQYLKVENSVYYRDDLVGNLTLPSATLPAKGSAILPCPLLLQIDKFVADIGDLVQDILQGKITVETKAHMPGRITVLGLFKPHIDTYSHCKLVMGFPSMKIETQVCDVDVKL